MVTKKLRSLLHESDSKQTVFVFRQDAIQAGLTLLTRSQPSSDLQRDRFYLVGPVQMFENMTGQGLTERDPVDFVVFDDREGVVTGASAGFANLTCLVLVVSVNVCHKFV